MEPRCALQHVAPPGGTTDTTMVPGYYGGVSVDRPTCGRQGAEDPRSLSYRTPIPIATRKEEGPELAISRR
eukprot:gene8999-biopygen322